MRLSTIIILSLLLIIFAIFINRATTDVRPRSDSSSIFRPIVWHPSTSPIASLPFDDRLLRLTERLYEGRVLAPEHFAFDGRGGVYAGLADGRIVTFRVDATTGATIGDIDTVVRTGDEPPVGSKYQCGNDEIEHICGRPLGMAFDKSGALIVCDGAFGLMSIDVVRRTKVILLSHVAGQKLIFANSVVIGPTSGSIFFTDSSSRWSGPAFLYDLIESIPSGRLIQYDPITKVVRVLVDQISFVNGILIDPIGESYLLFVELNRAQILSVDLTAVRDIVNDAPIVHWDAIRDDHAGSIVSVLIDNLPGVPDNLAWDYTSPLSSAGGPTRFTVGCGATRVTMMDALAGLPAIRNLIVAFASQRFLLSVAKRTGLILVIALSDTYRDANDAHPNRSVRVAAIVDTIQDQNGEKYSLMAGAYQHAEYMYFSSVSNEMTSIVRMKWPNKHAHLGD